MNIGKLLGAVSPGLAATGLFGGGAQGVGQGLLSAASPLMALLLHKKGGGAGAPPAQAPDPTQPGAPGIIPNVQPGSAVNVAQIPVSAGTPSLAQAVASLPQPATIHAGMDPAKRQRIAQMLLSFGGNMGGFGQPRY